MADRMTYFGLDVQPYLTDVLTRIVDDLQTEPNGSLVSLAMQR